MCWILVNSNTSLLKVQKITLYSQVCEFNDCWWWAVQSSVMNLKTQICREGIVLGSCRWVGGATDLSVFLQTCFFAKIPVGAVSSEAVRHVEGRAFLPSFTVTVPFTAEEGEAKWGLVSCPRTLMVEAGIEPVIRGWPPYLCTTASWEMHRMPVLTLFQGAKAWSFGFLEG